MTARNPHAWKKISFAVGLLLSATFALPHAATAFVTVDVANEVGAIKPVNGIGQPPMVGQLNTWPMLRYLKDAGIPCSRLHDVGGWLGHGLYLGVSLAQARCHITDAERIYTIVPLDLKGDGKAVVRMQPNSFAVVEW